MRAAAALADLAQDAAGHVVAGQQLRGPPGALVPLRVAPALLLVVGGLAAVVLRNVGEHEADPLAVAQHSPLAAHPFGHQDPAHAGRPDHARRMELDELHVLERRTRVIGERLSIAGVLPAVAGDRVGAADAAGGEDDGLAAVQPEPAPLAVVAQRSRDPPAVGEQPQHGALHVHVHALVDAVVLQRADHLQPGAVAHVRQPRVLVPAEVALEDAAVRGAIEQRAPGLQLADPVRRLLGVQLGHAPVVDVLAAAHRVGEMHPPVVAVVHVGQRRRDPALGHHGVRLPQKRLAHQSHRHAGAGCRDRRPEPGAAGADHQDVVLEGLVVGQKIRQSVQMPIEQRRT